MESGLVCLLGECGLGPVGYGITERSQEGSSVV